MGVKIWVNSLGAAETPCGFSAFGCSAAGGTPEAKICVNSPGELSSACPRRCCGSCDSGVPGMMDLL